MLTLTAPIAQTSISTVTNVRFYGDENAAVVQVQWDAFDTTGAPLPSNPQRGTLTPAQFKTIVSGAVTWKGGLYSMVQTILGAAGAGTVT